MFSSRCEKSLELVGSTVTVTFVFTILSFFVVVWRLSVDVSRFFFKCLDIFSLLSKKQCWPSHLSTCCNTVKDFTDLRKIIFPLYRHHFLLTTDKNNQYIHLFYNCKTVLGLVQWFSSNSLNGVILLFYAKNNGGVTQVKYKWLSDF